MSFEFKAEDASCEAFSPVTPYNVASTSPLIYKEHFPQQEIVRINSQESRKGPGRKRRPIYFGTIHIRDGRESAIVDIEGHDWRVSIHGKHINRAFTGDRVAVRLLPRGHWKAKIPPVLDLNYEPSGAATTHVGPLNVVAVFEDLPELEQARIVSLRSLKQILFDDGFGPSNSAWISFNTVYVTVTVGFSSSHDLNHKLASVKRKIIKTEHVRSVQLFTEQPPSAVTISASRDDTTSPSPTCCATR
jgi:hypothetical protein